jgi:microcystin-dependent protein
MARQTSPRYQISYVNPATRDEPADVPADIKRLVDAIEISAMFSQGPIASRPVSTPGTPGITGRFYYATNENRLYFDFGTGWQVIGPPVAGDTVPAGAVFQFAGAAAPAGYLLCDGASYLVANYPQLHAVIGFTYGGSGANFNVPDYRQRVPAGVDTPGGWVLGEKFGEETHVLTNAEMPSHAHGVSDPGHNHNIGDPQHPHAAWAGGRLLSADSVGYGQLGSLLQSGPVPGVYLSDITNYAVTGVFNYGNVTGISIQGNGGSGGHNNLQPTIVTNYIIRTGLGV